MLGEDQPLMLGQALVLHQSPRELGGGDGRGEYLVQHLMAGCEEDGDVVVGVVDQGGCPDGGDRGDGGVDKHVVEEGRAGHGSS